MSEFIMLLSSIMKQQRFDFNPSFERKLFAKSPLSIYQFFPKQILDFQTEITDRRQFLSFMEMVLSYPKACKNEGE